MSKLTWIVLSVIRRENEVLYVGLDFNMLGNHWLFYLKSLHPLWVMLSMASSQLPANWSKLIFFHLSDQSDMHDVWKTASYESLRCKFCKLHTHFMCVKGWSDVIHIKGGGRGTDFKWTTCKCNLLVKVPVPIHSQFHSNIISGGFGTRNSVIFRNFYMFEGGMCKVCVVKEKSVKYTLRNSKLWLPLLKQ